MKSKYVSEYHNFLLFDETNEFEKEENLFTTELILDDEEVLENFYGIHVFYDAAKVILGSSELLDFKFRIKQWNG